MYIETLLYGNSKLIYFSSIPVFSFIYLVACYFCTGGTLGHYKRAYIISYLDSPPPYFSFMSLPYLLITVWIGFIVPFFIHEYTQYFHHPFIMPCPSHCYQPLVKTCFTFLSFFFIQTKDIFLCIWWLHREFHCNIFVYVCAHIYVLYPKVGHSLHYSPFYLSPLLMAISTGVNVSYSYLHRKYIHHIYLYALH
jgi:hypothetical protein